MSNKKSSAPKKAIISNESLEEVSHEGTKETIINLVYNNKKYSYDRKLLINTCEYFNKMFSGNFMENKDNNVEILFPFECSDEVFGKFFEVLKQYKSMIKKNVDNVVEPVDKTSEEDEEDYRDNFDDKRTKKSKKDYYHQDNKKGRKDKEDSESDESDRGRPSQQKHRKKEATKYENYKPKKKTRSIMISDSTKEVANKNTSDYNNTYKITLDINRRLADNGELDCQIYVIKDLQFKLKEVHFDFLELKDYKVVVDLLDYFDVTKEIIAFLEKNISDIYESLCSAKRKFDIIGGELKVVYLPQIKFQ